MFWPRILLRCKSCRTAFPVPGHIQDWWRICGGNAHIKSGEAFKSFYFSSRWSTPQVFPFPFLLITSILTQDICSTEPLAHVDFYPNGGLSQVFHGGQCHPTSCSLWCWRVPVCEFWVNCICGLLGLKILWRSPKKYFLRLFKLVMNRCAELVPVPAPVASLSVTLATMVWLSKWFWWFWYIMAQSA